MKVLVIVLVIFIFIIFTLVAEIQSIIMRKHCTQTLKAKYVGCVLYNSIKQHLYMPQFSYQYDGVHYTETCKVGYHKKTINNKFRHKGEYRIYMNPSKPREICLKQGLGISDFILFVFLMFLMGAEIYLIRLCILYMQIIR